VSALASHTPARSTVQASPSSASKLSSSAARSTRDRLMPPAMPIRMSSSHGSMMKIASP
jgi:hypothetical protein